MIIYRAHIENGYIEHLDEAEARALSDNVEVIEREIEQQPTE